MKPKLSLERFDVSKWLGLVLSVVGAEEVLELPPYAQVLVL